MHLHSSIKSFLDGVSGDALVLTPNQRLARTLTKAYDQHQSADNKNVWLGPRFLSVGLWLTELWNLLQLRGLADNSYLVRMSQVQEQQLWQQAVDGCSDIDDLVTSDTIQSLCAEAWRWLRQFEVGLDAIPGGTTESTVLKTVINQYDELCRRKQLIDDVDLALIAVKQLDCIADSLPSNILAMGFDELGQVERRLFAKLEVLPSNFSQHDVRLNASVTRYEFGQWEQELEQVARWAARILEQKINTRIGVVVPDLADKRPIVERIFDEVFEPQKRLLNEPRHSPLYTISAGQPLVRTPLIASAFDLLNLNRRRIDRITLERLAYSRFWVGALNFAQIQKLAAEIKQEFIEVPVSEIRARLADYEHQQSLIFISLSDFESLRQSFDGKQKNYSEWSAVFTAQLQAVGWPGPFELDTYEYQQLSHWPQLMEQLSSLDSVCAKVTFDQAYDSLRRIAYTPFHAQSADSPLQVLGALEAAGQTYDELWVVGLDARVWPESIKPNPLLPLGFQKQLGMPRSSSERELKIAKILTARFAQSATRVTFSHCSNDGDQPLVVSPLIASYPLLQWSPPEGDDQLKQGSVVCEQMETFQDDFAPPVFHPEDMKGGVKAIKEQAACPFRAFARLRLFAERPELCEEGVSALLRGNLLHLGLESVWNKIKSQHELKSMSETQIESLVSESLGEAWSSLPEARRLGEQFRQLESKRNLQLMIRWLESEKQREPFDVASTEKSGSMTLAGLPINFRFDRVDRVSPEGDLFVIDYKSGEVNIKHWLHDRPEEPQVPLYCLALRGQRLVGAGFAQINRREVAIKGIAKRVEYAPGLRLPQEMSFDGESLDWEGLISRWDQILNTLAQDFVRGKANVDPLSPSTCQYCDLSSLCRIGDQQKVSDE